MTTCEPAAIRWQRPSRSESLSIPISIRFQPGWNRSRRFLVVYCHSNLLAYALQVRCSRLLTFASAQESDALLNDRTNWAMASFASDISVEVKCVVGHLRSMGMIQTYMHIELVLF